MPDDEVIAACENYPEAVGKIDCVIGDEICFIVSGDSYDDGEYPYWTYRFDDGNRLFDVFDDYLKKYYGKDFCISVDKGTKIGYFFFTNPNVDSTETNLNRKFQILVTNLKKCLSTYEVKIDVYKDKVYLTWFGVKIDFAHESVENVV